MVDTKKRKQVQYSCGHIKQKLHVTMLQGLSAGFSGRFLSNAGSFDKIPAVSGLVRGLFSAFFVKRGWF